MDTVMLVLSLFAFLAALFLALVNFGCCLLNARNRAQKIDKHYSTVPFVSIFLTYLGICLSPWSFSHWFWVIPFLDVANFLAVTGLLAQLLGKIKGKVK